MTEGVGVILQGRSPVEARAEEGDSDAPLAFKALLFLVFMIYVAPQAIIPALEPLHLAKVSAGLAIATYGLATLRGHRFTVMTTEIKLILCFVGIAVISIPGSVWPGGSLDFFFDIFSKSVIVFFMVANLLTSQKRLHTLLWAICMFSAFNAFTAVNGFLHGNVMVAGDLMRSRGGYSGLSQDPNDLALSLNIAIPFVWYLFEYTEKRFEKILLGVMLALCIIGVVVTYSRGGFLGLLGLFLWMMVIQVKKRGIGALLKGLILAAVFFALAPGSYSERILTIGDSSKDVTGSSDVRWTLMKEAVNITMEHPFGAGLKMHNVLIKRVNSAMVGVHSAFLEVAADLGVIGLVLFSLVFWKLMRSMQQIRASPLSSLKTVGLAEATEVSLVAFGVSGMFLAVAYQVPFYLLAGITIAVKDLAGRLHASCAQASV